MTKVAKVVKSPNEIELFTKQCELLDDMLLFIQNLPATNLTHKIKCKNVALFLDNYGYCWVK